jgi:xanthine dehydrogenase large subunit
MAALNARTHPESTPRTDFAAGHFGCDQDSVRFQRQPGERRFQAEFRFEEFVNLWRITSACPCRPPVFTAHRRSTTTATRPRGRPFFYYANGAAVSEVIVDTLTGEYRVSARRHLPRCRGSA